MKKPDNPKYSRLSNLERVTIQRGLDDGMTVTDIAKELGRSQSSIKREIERNKEVISSCGNDCRYKKDCQERMACPKRCNHRLCKHCKSVVCYLNNNCTEYTKSYCDRLINESPHVCNGCRKRQSCPYEKYIYKSGAADKKATQNKKDKIRQFLCTDEQIEQIDELISPLIRNGQSPAVALSTVRNVVGISTSTLYRMIDAGLLGVRNIDLPEKVGRRKRRTAKPRNKDAYLTLASEKKGHMYADFIDYMKEHDDVVVEMDCVEGRRTDPEAILSLHWKEHHMQLYFMLAVHDAENVVRALDIIEEKLGLELFSECLPVILTDNGEEFTDIEGMERSYTVSGQQRTRIFFCEPNRSDQKGSCERNHRLLRKIVPKRTSWEDSRNKSIHGLKQEQMTLVSNHINSYPCPDMNFIRPYEMAMGIMPKEFFELLGLKAIPIKEILLKPELIYR